MLIPFTNNLMPFRYEQLDQTLIGYQMTGMPLVTYDSNQFIPAGISDDTGIYYFVPKIANFFNLGLDQSISAFFLFFFCSSILVSLFSIFKIFPNIKQRATSLFFVFTISVYMFLRGDIYIMSSTTMLTIIPLSYYLKKKGLINYIHYIIYFGFGLLISVSNFIRSNSATGVLLFLLLFVFLTQKANKKFLIYTYLVLVAGFLITNLFFASLKSDRDDYLNSINAVKAENFVKGHSFWHTVYLGLGYLNNPYKIEYSDNCGFMRAKLFQPNIVYYSNEYENLMKNEVINLLKMDPWFITKTIISKLGVVIFYLLIFSNIGIIYIFKSFKNLTFNIPILICLMFNLIFPLLTMPFPSYLMGAVCTVMILSVISMDIDNNKNKLNDVNNSLKEIG